MSVHKEITAHSKKQNEIVKEFVTLDAQREAYIEEALKLYQNGEPFTTDKINEVSRKINELARKGIAPQRKYVTIDMVKEYAEKLKNNQ